MTNNNLIYTITKKEEGLSIKNFLLAHGFSSAFLVSLRNHNQVFLNNQIQRFWTPLKIGDILNVNPYILKPSTIDPISMALDILYEDSDFIAIKKPYNIPTHPTTRHLKDTVANGIAAYFEKKGLTTNVRPIHRLDKTTSGILLFGKHPLAQHSVSQQMMHGETQKIYQALVMGSFPYKKGIITLPINREANSIIKRGISPHGKMGITTYKRLGIRKNHSLLELNLLTGRTHQIRVHLSALGYPIIGDFLYGIEATSPFLALHSSQFSFTHFRTGKTITLTCPLPNNYLFFWQSLLT